MPLFCNGINTALIVDIPLLASCQWLRNRCHFLKKNRAGLLKPLPVLILVVSICH